MKIPKIDTSGIKKTEKEVRKKVNKAGKKVSSMTKDTFGQDKQLDHKLESEIKKYNKEYENLSSKGNALFNQRERSIDLLEKVEQLINSIANSPKSFTVDIEEVKVKKAEFKSECDFAKKKLKAAKKSAAGTGAGVAGGATVAAMAPSAAMWVATTFGTASTGTAISALSGAAAHSAALAWLGGGALAAGGGGAAAGEALLALAGPVGWGIAGATLLTSIVLFSINKQSIAKDQKNEIKAVIKNTERLKKTEAKIEKVLTKTEALRMNLDKQYGECMAYFNQSFLDLPEESQLELATLVNNAKSLAYTLEERIA